MLPDMLTEIAQGGDIAAAAATADAAIEVAAQRLDSRFRQPPDSPHHVRTEPMASAVTPALVAGDPITSGRRRGAKRRRSSALPYWLLLPSIAVMVVMLGYPLYRLVVLSGQEYGLEQVFGQPAAWVGLDNFREILNEPYFWTVLWRTLIFCSVNVALTMSLGVLIGLLLQPRQEDAAARVDVADPRLGDAGAHRDRRVAVDLRHPVRPRQLGVRRARASRGSPSR